MKISEKHAVDFVVNNLNQCATEHFQQDTMKEFLDLVKQGKEIAAAEAYQKTTNSSMSECRFAVAIAQELFV